MEKWRKDLPLAHGYYLGAWQHSVTGKIIVSELWYNPDAIYRWWFTRGYANQPKYGGVRDALPQGVVAWMFLPDPPKD